MNARYFADVRLFDGRTVRSGMGVLVERDTVAWTGPHRRAPKEARAATAVAGEGRMLTPGLIDCHVHLCFDGGADFVGEARGATDAYAAVKCVRNGQRQLAAGVTTIRDLGGFRAVVCEVARAVDEGRVTGPRIVASGQALTITGGHGWNSFAREADGPDEVRKAVREQLRSGARSIKIVATGGVLTPGVSFDFTAFTPEEVEAAVDEAHKWGVPIAAHAIGAAGILNCVKAGIDSIEHGAQITPETARLMKAKGTFHVATISALRGIVDNPATVPEFAVRKGLQVLEFAHDSFRRAMRSGVRHACGTDAGTPYNPHGNAPREMLQMIDWGLSPLRAFQSATSNAAELLRMPSVGLVEAGRAADLVLWPGDPIEDPQLLLSPSAVVLGGHVVSGAL